MSNSKKPRKIKIKRPKRPKPKYCQKCGRRLQKVRAKKWLKGYTHCPQSCPEPWKEWENPKAEIAAWEKRMGVKWTRSYETSRLMSSMAGKIQQSGTG